LNILETLYCKKAFGACGLVRFAPEIKRAGIDIPKQYGWLISFLQDKGNGPGNAEFTDYAYAIFFNLPEAVDSAAIRLREKSTAAWMKAVNSGWPALGVEVNSG
jgi:hypothetical protein